MATTKVTEAAISLPFAIDDRGNVVKTTAQNKIWADRITGALGTTIGTRLMRSGYGVEINNYFLDTVDAFTTEIESEVQRIFTSTFPTLTLNTVTPIFDESSSVLTVNIEFSLPDLTDQTVEVGISGIDGASILREVNQ